MHQEGEGEKKEKTDWYTVNVWGHQAESCVRYLQKGQAVMIEGYLSTYQIEKEGGTKDRRIGITALKVEFLAKPMSHAPIEVLQ